MANTLIDLLPKTVLTETSFYGWKEGRTWKGFFHDLYQLFCKCNLTNSSTFSLDDVRNGYASPEFFAEKSIIHLKTSHGKKTEGEWNNLQKELVSALKTQVLWEQEFQSNLTDWAAGYRDRLQARCRILAFLNDPAQSQLNLSSLELTDLPDIFSRRAFSSRLKNLNLNNTRLTSLPESFGDLLALQDLCLDNTPLTSLPESFGSLISLQWLHLHNTRLTSLPESFGSLSALHWLDLRGTPLISLPESFGGLLALEKLHLNETSFTSLPESFGSLSALKWLYLHDTPLTSLPSTITSLRTSLEIDISTLPLSEEVQSRLQTATQVPGYIGPRFIYSMAHVERRGEDPRSTVELVRDLYQELQEPLLTLNKDLEENGQLRSWLSRLSYMADYKAGGENKKALLQNILAYLRLANENSEFQEVFLAIINGAADTCGDRVALSILQIGIAYKIHRADLGRPQDLAHLLLRGVYAMGLLADIARAKVSTLSFVDEIEVYLGYPLKLKEALDLPIDVRNMLYFLCSALTDTDLRNAERIVKEGLDNSDTCHEFLIGHETWLKCLERNFTRDFNALKGARDAASDAAVGEADYEKIKKDYEKGLIDLTKKALGPWDDFRHQAR